MRAKKELDLEEEEHGSCSISEVIRSVLFFYDKISQVQKRIQSTKSTTNLRFIDLKFIDIRFIDLKFNNITFINLKFIDIRFIDST